MQKRDTYKKDCKGKKIYEGDVVLKWWGGCISFDRSKQYDIFRIHKIRYDDEESRFLLGNSYNTWKGAEVEKVSVKNFKGVKLDEGFYMLDGKIEYPTDIELYGEKAVYNFMESYKKLIAKVFEIPIQ